jgi:hypothetical protein
MESDRAYFERRAAEEQRAAEAASSEDVRRRHLTLARLLEAHGGEAGSARSRS